MKSPRSGFTLAQGLPIATGARWGLDRAEAILKLRSLKISGDLDSYMAFHFRQEQKRNYPQTPTPLWQYPTAA